MAGLSKDDPVPTEIKLHQRSRLMEVAFDDGRRFELSYEFLRVFSPSAEVRGHGVGQEVLQLGKRLRRTSQPEGQGEDGRSQQRVEQQMLHSKGLSPHA